MKTYHVEIQAINANAGIILDAQINVFLDAKAEVAAVWEIVLPQLILAHLDTVDNKKIIFSSPAVT